MRTLQEIDAERATVLDEKAELEGDAEHIKLKLADARAKVRENGEYSDSDWWYRANDALRIKKGNIRRLAQRLSRLKSERSEVGQTIHLERTSATSDNIQKEVTSALFRIVKCVEDYLVGVLEEDDFREKMEHLLAELHNLKSD